MFSWGTCFLCQYSISGLLGSFRCNASLLFFLFTTLQCWCFCMLLMVYLSTCLFQLLLDNKIHWYLDLASSLRENFTFSWIASWTQAELGRISTCMNYSSTLSRNPTPTGTNSAREFWAVATGRCSLVRSVYSFSWEVYQLHECL